MDISITPSWKLVLQNEFNKDYFKNLMNFVAGEYQQQVCYPDEQEIFAAFNACSFDDLKVVIIGQDPYHGPKQANGLCFSVHNGINHPPSLKNIFKELEQDLNIKHPVSGDLSTWAKQGVLLLNATLTVQASKAGSHQKKGWETFTDAVIEIIATQKQDVVFLLWGGYAKKKGKKIDTARHCVLTSGHPSPLSANRKLWFGHRHFSKTNYFLIKKGKTKINWELE